MTKKSILLIAGLLLSFLSASKLPTDCEIEQKLLQVGFILVGSHLDYGWNYAHDQGRFYLEKHMPGQVHTTLVENVPESAEIERVMEKMIAQGNKVIFATSYGYLEPALRVAARHPDIIIMQAGPTSNEKYRHVFC